MLFDPARHEACTTEPWSEAAAAAAIERIVRDAESAFSAAHFWPAHPRDVDPCTDPVAQASHDLYSGSAGVIWALQHLQHVGAATLERDYAPFIDEVASRLGAFLASERNAPERASTLVGETGLRLLRQALRPEAANLDALETLIASNIDHPARELLLGAPGTMLAALFLHEVDGDARWADLFRRNARHLWTQLLWSDEAQCHYWTQELYGKRSTYLDAVHGFVATAAVLIRGRHLFDADEWAAWQSCIETTIARTAAVEDGRANWPAWLQVTPGRRPPMLMQFCHGAPGFVICLAELPGSALDDLLVAAGEAVWRAGPLTKGSNLCHGTGGNGYAFLKLYQRTGDARWLDRARAFAMHGIAQVGAEFAAVGRGRYSLWTGDPGFAIYLHDCLRARAGFPTLDFFFARSA